MKDKMQSSSSRGTLPHILAPINSYEGATKVVDAGAEEIYCAVQIADIRDFVLYRGPSSELKDYDELKQVVQYAHAHGSKVNLVLNQPYMVTAIEEPVRKHIRNCVDQGVDTLIIGDFGVLSIVKSLGVKIPLVASTYLMSMNTEAIALLEDMGFSRAVLDRQLTLEEITHIVHSTKMGIEILIHGGGCSNLNASCYFYHYQFPELANAERESKRSTPCSLPFDLRELNNPQNTVKDVSVMDAFEYCSICNLPELISTGVIGLKIEGRTANVWYQESTTRIYRELLDLIAEGRMSEYRKRLTEIKEHVYFAPVQTSFHKLKDIWCLQKRCYYSPIVHAPYKIPLTWQGWTKQHFTWVVT
ncbi:U32 family peptidase [Candidatus Bathyarchaeota archaeon]|nr:U32 family peptidase [Candidatus Bathyarchaeota archaeon]